MLGLVPCLEIWGRTYTPVPLNKAQNKWQVEGPIHWSLSRSQGQREWGVPDTWGEVNGRQVCPFSPKHFLPNTQTPSPPEPRGCHLSQRQL